MGRSPRGGRTASTRGGTKGRGRGRPRKTTTQETHPVENDAQEPQQVELQIHPDPAGQAVNVAAHPTLVHQLRQQPHLQLQQEPHLARTQRVIPYPPQWCNEGTVRIMNRRTQIISTTPIYDVRIPPEQHFPQDQTLYEHFEQPGSSSSGILQQEEYQQEQYNPDSQMAYEQYNPVAQPTYAAESNLAHGQGNSNPGSLMHNPASTSYTSPPEMPYDSVSSGHYNPHSSGSDEYNPASYDPESYHHVYSNQNAGPSSYYDPNSQAYNAGSAEHNDDQQYMDDYHPGQYDENQEYYQQGDPQNPEQWQEHEQNYNQEQHENEEGYEQHNQDQEEQQQEYDENGQPMQYEQPADAVLAMMDRGERESRRAAYGRLYEAPHDVPLAEEGESFIVGGLEPLDQLQFADDLWIRESTVVSDGQYFTFSEILVTQSDGYCRFYRLPWNRQENIRGNPRLVYHIKNFKCNADELNVGKPEMLTHLSVMMTAHGDAPDVNMYSIWTVARAIQLELICMIADIITSRQEQVEVKEEEPEEGEDVEMKEKPLKRTPPITYGEVVAWLRDNCPMRLRRLVQFQTAEQKRTSPIYRVEEPPQNRDPYGQTKHTYLLDKLEEKTPKDVLRFQKACPVLYRAMTEGVGKVENLRFYTCKEKKRGQIDKNLHRVTYFKKYLESRMTEEKREMVEDLKNVSMICGNGRKNAYFATLFHEFLAKPPLETDLIYVFDFLARELCRDIVTMTVASHTRFVEVDDAINCLLYKDAIEVILGRQRGLLRGPDYDLPPPGTYPVEKVEKKKVPTSIAEEMLEFNQRTNPLREMRKILTAKGKKEKKKMIKITGEDLVNAFVSMKMLNAHDAVTRALPPLPGLSKEQIENQKRMARKRVPKTKAKVAPATSGLLKALGLPWASKVAAQEAKPASHSRPARHPPPTQPTQTTDPVRPGEPLQKAPFGQPTTCTRLPGNRSSSESNDDEPVVVFARRTDQ